MTSPGPLPAHWPSRAAVGRGQASRPFKSDSSSSMASLTAICVVRGVRGPVHLLTSTA